ncbi:MAG: RNA polymerase sigma factor [Acidimicrobiales bacterium]
MATAAAGRQARFEAVMEAVYEPLQRYARRRCDPDAADDVVADALLVVWRRLEEVPDGALLPWCYRVAANCLANSRRAAGRRVRLATRVATLDPPRDVHDPTPPDPELHAALNTLSSSDQEVLRLWAWEDLAPTEIAVALGVSANAVSIRLHRAKGHLAQALERAGSPLDTDHHEDPEEVT